MASLNIAVLGEIPEKRQSTASALGKKSTPEDLTFYHTVFSGRKVNVVEPTSYPEKPLSLAYAINLSSYFILVADQPSAALGETLLALSLAGKGPGCVLSQGDVSAYLSALGLSHIPVFSDLSEAKQAALAFTPPVHNGPTKAYIDHSFEVKGLGAVALGYVARGNLKVHQKIACHPPSKPLEIKSIQQNDVDVEHAECFDRFGIRFKGLESSELSRGTLLSDSAKSVNQIEATVTCPKFWKSPPGSNLHAVVGMQNISCKTDKPLLPGKDNEVLLEFHKPVFMDHDDVWLFDLNAKGLRLAGIAKEVA
ncbi:MAG TPA: hypothetical protein VI874_01600 [Candidatus Norongarragalinales archaeon]|nr:hypothetical protein [Candidatus Norongarragalinales archaeon]